MKTFHVYFVANFKFKGHGPLCDGFKRLHFDTFFRSIQEARAHVVAGFCSEAGWYEGMLIKERTEGRNFPKSKRYFFVWNTDTDEMEEIPEPEIFRDCLNLIS